MTGTESYGIFLEGSSIGVCKGRQEKDSKKMTLNEFIKAWPILKKQVKSLHVPWLDEVASEERDPFKVLISCILSLRTQDKVTGEASRRLFKLAQTPESLSKLSVEKIEKAIYPVGFYRVKTRNIKEISADIIAKHHGRVPDTIEELSDAERRRQEDRQPRRHPWLPKRRDLCRYPCPPDSQSLGADQDKDASSDRICIERIIAGPILEGIEQQPRRLRPGNL